ncbi:MAG: PilT/PilU family type 4a pilus ATPase [Pseudomonadota bacterium]
MSADLDTMLADMLNRGASDLHLATDALPAFRVRGKLFRDVAMGETSADWIATTLETLGGAYDVAAYRRAMAADFGITRHGMRFRINLFRHAGGDALAIRCLGAGAMGFAQLGLPPAVEGLTATRTGLVLVCGATGSGKSTTLAAMIDRINRTRADHILTIEDPVETLHEDQMGIVRQRELTTHTTDFASAIRSALREDPDVILVGEMRDLDTMRAALTAAETGHLVFSTLHTCDAAGAVRRLIGAFPANEQDAVRLRLSQSMRAVIAQHLLPTANGLGRVPAIELMLCTPAIGHMIRSNKLEQLYSAIEGGRALGMQTLEQSLAALHGDGWISRETAESVARDPEAFARLAG